MVSKTKLLVKNQASRSDDAELARSLCEDNGQSPFVADPEMQGLTLYEKKALLVNRELAAQGMGRYQWMIFLLCGFGYFLDLLWAQAFGLILAPIQAEFDFSSVESGNLSTSFSAGLTAGAAFWGIMTDIIGRYWAFNCTVLLASVFGLCLGSPDTYNGVLVLTAFVGLGVGGNIPIDTTICLELLPQNRRWLLPALSIFQPLGVVVCSAIAYGFIPNYSCASDASCKSAAPGQACCTKAQNWGWRYLMFTLGAITLFVFIARFVLFRFQESPKYLLYRGEDEKAVKALQYIAKYNKVKCRITLESFRQLTEDDSSINSREIDDRKGRIVLGSGNRLQNLSLMQKAKLELIRLSVLFGTPMMAWLTICMWVVYMFDYWGFTIAGAYLPYILQQKGRAIGLTLLETYRSYIYIYIFGFPGVLAGTLIYQWRQLSMILSSALFGAMLFTFTVVHDQQSYIGINGLVYFFQSMFNAILYGSTPEFFPAPVRATAAGVASFWGRLFSIIAPLAAARVLDQSANGVLYLAGEVCLSALCFCVCYHGGTLVDRASRAGDMLWDE